MKYRFFLALLLAGILGLPASLVAQETPVGVSIHVVQRGENLFRIALRYGLTVEELAELNGILDVSSIQVGQRLLVPTGDALPPTPPTEHTVQPGETLQSIAGFYRKTVDELSVLNNISDPNTIYVGQVLKIASPVDSVLPTPTVIAANPTPQEVTSPASVIHIVQPGETLFRIATNYGLDVNDLARANNLSDPTLIYAGQQLLILGVEPPHLALDLPATVVSLDVTPQVWVNGQTGRVQLRTHDAAAVRGVFLGQTVPAAAEENDTLHILLVGIPIATAASIYPLEVTVAQLNGQTTAFTVNIQILGKNYGSQSLSLPADKQNLLDVNIENNELSILQTLSANFSPTRFFSGPMGLPAAAAMNGSFGAERSYNGGAFDRYHYGADFAGAPGTPVLAAAAGQVIMTDTLHIRGVVTMIDHGWGVYTTYSHQAEQYVKVGDFVATGQIIGTIGATGRTTGAHLHWEIWVHSIPVDPMQWVEQAFP